MNCEELLHFRPAAAGAGRKLQFNGEKKQREGMQAGAKAVVQHVGPKIWERRLPWVNQRKCRIPGSSRLLLRRLRVRLPLLRSFL